MALIRNGYFTNIEGSFLMVGTEKFTTSTDDNPFVVSLESVDDFEVQGLDYADFADMEVGDALKDKEFDGILIIRIK